MRLLVLALLVAVAPAQTIAEEIFVDQGGRWTPDARRSFYKADQGSRIMPYAWLAALTQKDGTPFLADSLTRYGYLKDPQDQASLPVGFTITGVQGAQSVGMTCSACHTRRIAVGDQQYRIDGGPALVDFQAFLEDLDTSVGAVLASDDAFNAFAGKVFGDAAHGPSDVASLKRRVTAWYERYHILIERSLRQPGQGRWGMGRLDAITMIFNRVTGLGLGPPPSRIIADNIQPADAPARYPFLWNAPMQDLTQWAGFARNGNDWYALSRNVGQVLGVFGEYQPRKEGLFVNFLYGNSVNFDGLSRLEDLVKMIGPPKWPWALKQELVGKGKEIYARPKGSGGCKECHRLRADIPSSVWPTPVMNDHTDIRQYMVLGRTAQSGELKGAFIPFATKPLKKTANAIDILATSVIGSIAENTLGLGGGNPSAVADAVVAFDEGALEAKRLPPELRDLERAFMTQQPSNNLVASDTSAVVHGAYEARVLEGIWAAAPYLHNGSVPTLWQLLTPVVGRDGREGRRASFMVGPQYDSREVGLALEQPPTAQKLETTDCSKLDSGNSRCGHEWGVGLSDDEKWALIEYLKTL